MIEHEVGPSGEIRRVFTSVSDREALEAEMARALDLKRHHRLGRDGEPDLARVDLFDVVPRPGT